MRCLVTGSTGYVGGRLVPQLLQRGLTVRAMARRPDKLDDAPWRRDVEVVGADLMDPGSLAVACKDADVVYYLAHSMGTAADFVAHERQSVENLIVAARRAGVRRIVYLGGLIASDAPLSEHLRSRAGVGEQLLASGIETVVLQAGIIVGAGSASFEMIRYLTKRLPLMIAPRWVDNLIQPIAIDDVLHYLVAAVDAPVPRSRTWDIGGPDVLRYVDMIGVYAEIAGLRRRRIMVVPVLTPTLASWWVGWVTPIPLGLARPLIKSLQCDAVMSEHDIDSVIEPPAAGLTGYRDAVELALRQPISPRAADFGPQRTDGAPKDTRR
jgi:uncharacterized protein YbjT (DUF2867 family)